MGPIGCPETSVKDEKSTLRNIPEERRSRKPEITERHLLTRQLSSVSIGNSAEDIVCTTGESEFDSREGQKFFFFSTTSAPALGCNQTPVQRILRCFFGDKAAGA
jgi:hypothetical protein